MKIFSIPHNDPDILPVPFYQSQGWQEVLAKDTITSIRFVVEGDGIIQTLAIVYPVSKFLGNYIYIPRGPIMSESVSQADITAWKNHIDTLAKTHNARWAMIEPDTLSETHLEWLNQITTSLSKARLPHQTLKVDLSKSRDDLLEEMGKKTRYNIRLSEKRGTSVIKVTKQDPLFEEIFDAFCNLLEETSDRADFSIHNRKHYQNILQTHTENFSPYLIASYNDSIITAVHMFVDTLRETVYLHGGSSHQHRSLMGPYLIQWEAIIQAKAAGLSTYDFWGTSDTKESWKGITRFKRKFGGFTINYPETRALIFSPIGSMYKWLSTKKK